ncbi:MAG TPA: tetratricopeptide repeat protein [Terriglobales bacterium]|nr:tetratricopeptide repeat protein [Terriglobales bacterium]
MSLKFLRSACAFFCVPFLLTLAPAQTPPADPPLTPAAKGYLEFELGKFAELQAENKGGSAYIQQALEHFTAAMAANPDSPYVACQMADLLSRIGRNTDAITLVRSVIKDHSDNLDAHQTLGEIYLRELSREHQPIAPALAAEAIAEYKTLQQLEPANPDPTVILGKLYGAEGQPGLAEQQFRSALAIAPTNMDALASLVQSLAGEGRLDQAQQEIASLPPDARSGMVYATLGDAFRGQHRYDQAAKAYGQAVAAQPGDPDLQRALAQALMDGGDYAKALTAFQELETLSPDDGQAALRTGQIQMQLGQFDAAAKSLATASRLLPATDGKQDMEVAYAHALLDESQGRYQPAVDELKALIDRKSTPGTQAIFLDHLASLEIRTADYTGAEATIAQLQALGAAHADRARALSIELYGDQRDYPRALAAARAALAGQPDSPSLDVTYANLLASSGDARGAVAWLQPKIHGDAPHAADDASLYLAISQIQENARQYSLAQEAAAHADALASTPEEHARAQSRMGAIASAQHDYAAAEASFKKALVLAPNDADTLNSMAYLLAQQGTRLPEALAYIQRALARDAGNGAYLDTLGWVYFKLNRIPEAESALQRASLLNRHDPLVLDHLAQAYDRDGKLRQAEASWRQALDDLKHNPGADAQRTAEIEKQLDAVRTRLAHQ